MKVYPLRKPRTLTELAEFVELTARHEANRAKIQIYIAATHARMAIDRRVESLGVPTYGLYSAKVRLNCLYGKFLPGEAS